MLTCVCRKRAAIFERGCHTRAILGPYWGHILAMYAGLLVAQHVVAARDVQREHADTRRHVGLVGDMGRDMGRDMVETWSRRGRVTGRHGIDTETIHTDEKMYGRAMSATYERGMRDMCWHDMSEIWTRHTRVVREIYGRDVSETWYTRDLGYGRNLIDAAIVNPEETEHKREKR